jgi:Na+/H+ antiporter
MTSLELILLLLVIAGVLQVIARRWQVPHPVLLVLGGALLATLPGLPRVELDPEILFLIFVPPLLYGTSLTTSLREFRAAFWPIARLGILLVLVTIAAVAVVAHALTPEFSWPAAFVLAAIVAPPDPVAATAVLRALGAPAAIESILEGEGLVNDATALVAYRLAVAATVSGLFSPWRAAGSLALTGVVGVAIGIVVGYGIVWIRGQLHDFPIVANTLSLLTPYVAYLPADRLGASGVLAVVACGFYLSRRGPMVVPAATRVQAEAIWALVTFLLESLIFILTGLELPYAVAALHGHALGTLLGISTAIGSVVIAVRLLWVFPSAYLPPLATRFLSATERRGDRQPLPPWQWVLFVGWAGMRGGDSLVIALALPRATQSGAPFPARDLIIFVTFAVIFATLVLQGLSLRPLLGWLGLHDDGQAAGEEAHARRVAAEAGLRQLDELAQSEDADPAVVHALRQQERARRRRWAVLDTLRHGQGANEPEQPDDRTVRQTEAVAERHRRLRFAMIAAERQSLSALRDQDIISDEVLRRVQRDLDLETMLLEASADDAPESPYEGT